MDTNPIFFHYKEEVTSITTLFRLDLKDGTKMGFTSFDKDIVIVSAASCMEIWDTSIYNSIDNDGFDYVKAAEELLKDWLP